jgi:protein TonB
MELPEDATMPVAVSTPPPTYPPGARQQGIEALVVVRFTIDERGDVKDVTILRGHPLFDQVVTDAVRRWKYRPGQVRGKPVAMKRVVKVPFRIKP